MEVRPTHETIAPQGPENVTLKSTSWSGHSVKQILTSWTSFKEAVGDYSKVLGNSIKNFFDPIKRTYDKALSIFSAKPEKKKNPDDLVDRFLTEGFQADAPLTELKLETELVPALETALQKRSDVIINSTHYFSSATLASTKQDLERLRSKLQNLIFDTTRGFRCQDKLTEMLQTTNDLLAGMPSLLRVASKRHEWDQRQQVQTDSEEVSSKIFEECSKEINKLNKELTSSQPSMIHKQVLEGLKIRLDQYKEIMGFSDEEQFKTDKGQRRTSSDISL